MYHQIWALAGLSIYSLLNRVAAQPDIPEVVFDCSVTPGACTNMCWGAYCSGYEVLLSFDKASKKVKRDRRAKAGCGKGNRCGDQSPDPDGNSCDEYPFASVEEADKVQQVNRCIPGSEQDSQGGTLSSFYQNSLKSAPGQFIVGFGNPDDSAVQYCNYDQHCLNDGNQFLGDDLAPDGPQDSKKHKRNYYRLESGMPFLSTRDLLPGSKVKRVVKRSEAEMTLIKRGGGNPFDLVDDVVLASV
ncbi:hypothetical protein MMC22_006646 [Lobaria immixta]|nr:hypothetical protein [Lobaria immixta]